MSRTGESWGRGLPEERPPHRILEWDHRSCLIAQPLCILLKAYTLLL